MTNGESWFKTFGCLGTIVAALFVGAFAFVIWPSIEGSQADQAQAEASIESARASAQIAEARAKVDELIERNSHELALLREENRQFQERLILLATIVEGMDGRNVSTLERWLGLGGTSPWAAVLAAGLALGAFLLLRRFINARLEAMWK